MCLTHTKLYILLAGLASSAPYLNFQGRGARGGTGGGGVGGIIAGAAGSGASGDGGVREAGQGEAELLCAACQAR